MSDRGSATASGGTGLVAAGAVIVLLAAAAVYLSLRDDGQIGEEDVAALLSPSGVPVVKSTPLAAPDHAGAGRAGGEPVPVDAPDDAQAPEDTAPRIDEIRVDGSGMVVVAGRASPGSRVEVVVDGAVISSAEVDSSGAFAALGRVAASDTTRSLTLRSEQGARVLLSEEEIILAPTPAPDGTAQASVPRAAPGADKTAPEITASSGRAATPSLLAPAASPFDAGNESTPAATEAQARDDPDATVPEVSGTETLSRDPVTNSAPSGEAAPATAQAEAQPEPEAPRPSVAQETPQSGRIAVLRSDADGVALIQTAPADRVVLDTIGYSRDGHVQLSGRAGGAAVEVRAYLDNRLVGQIPVRPDGSWRGDVPDVLTGVYNLRIDALGGSGAVTSRLETPFQREAPEAIAAATRSSLRSITVQTGDTLWAIARERYGEGVFYVQVFEANRATIRDPDLIYPGQIFDLPSEEMPAD